MSKALIELTGTLRQSGGAGSGSRTGGDRAGDVCLARYSGTSDPSAAHRRDRYR